MKNRVGLFLILSVLAGSAAGSAELPAPRTVLRVHTHVVFTDDLSISDADFVFAYSKPPKSRSTLPSIVGYINRNAGHPNQPVATSSTDIWSREIALPMLEANIAALKPAEMPSACSLDNGPFETGTFETTLYNGAAGAAQVITVSLEPNPPETSRCPASVENLLGFLNGFLVFYVQPIY